MKLNDLIEHTIVKGSNVSAADLKTILSGLYNDLLNFSISNKKHPEKTNFEVAGFPIHVIRDSSSATFYISSPSGLIAGLLYCEQNNYIKIKKHPIPKYESNAVWVYEGLRGKGFGTKFYEAAIETLGSIHSSDNIGSMAVGVWKKLSSKYNVKLFKNVINEKESGFVDYTWDGEIPMVDGKLITKLKDDFIFVIEK